MRRSLRDRLFASLPAVGGRRKRRAKQGWLQGWLRPGVEELESRRVLSAQDLHPDGTAFQVADSPFNTFVAADGNGDSVVTWQASPAGSSGMAIYAQQYNNQGHALGSAILVSGPPSPGSVQSAGVVADAGGDFVVIWKATDAFGGSSLEAQRYNAQGVGQGSTLPLPGDTDDQFSLDPAGNLLVVYESNSAIFAQRYNTKNNPVGLASQIDPTVPAGPFKMAADAEGNFLVSWFEQSSSSGATDLYARGYNDHGVAQSNEFLVVSSSDTTAAATPSELAMTGYGTGDFLIQWQNQTSSAGAVYTSLFAQRFDLQGAALDRQIAIAAPTTLGVNNTFIAAQDDGSFLVAGLPAGAGGNTNSLYAEQFGADDAEGEIFPITAPDVNAVGTSQYPLVFAVAGGNYLLSWLQTSTPAATSQQTYVSYYVASSANQAPQIAAAISDPSEAACDVFQIDLSGDFTDPDSDPLTYTIAAPGGGLLPAWLSLSDAGVLSGVAPLTSAGLDYPIQITATDLNGASVSQTFSLDVTAETHGQSASQFPVNGTSQIAVVASNAAGNSVVISTTPDNSIVGQLYNSQGQASGGQFVVASANFDDVPGLPAVAINAADDFLVTWVESSNGAAPSTSDVPGQFEPQTVYMQSFNAQAAASGPATHLALPSNQVPQGIPQVVADGTGEFDVAWLSTNSTFQTTLWLQRFDAGGTAQGSPVDALGSTFATPSPDEQQTYLGIAADSTGDVTLMWGTSGLLNTSTPTTGTINAQRLDASDNPVGSTLLVTSSAASVNPSIAEDPAGDFEIAWWQYAGGLYSLEVQPYSPSGAAIGIPRTIGTPTTILDQAATLELTGGPLGNITADPAGHFLVTWYGISPTQAAGTVTNEIYGQLLDSQANPIGGPFQVNTGGAAQVDPSAALDAAGNFVVAWTDGAGTGIDAQLYTPGISIGAPALQVAVENSPAEFVNANSNPITYSDSYGNNGVEQLTLTAPDGTLSLGSTTGITFTSGANGTSTMTIQGTVGNLSTALNGMTFTPTTGFTGAASLMINADNLGDSGSSGHLTGSTTVPIEVLNQSPFQVLGNTITVDSTGLGDNFFLRYPSATQLALTLDGYSQAFDPTTVSQVNFDGQGNSAATISGDGSATSAVFQPDTLSYTLASGLAVEIANTPAITASGEAGDTAVFYGGATPNTFVGTADSSSMTNGGSTNTAVGFGAVYAVATNASDAAYLSNTTGTFIGTPSYCELYGRTTAGAAFFLEAEGFQHVLATSTPGTNATAYFYDSDGSQPIVSTFVATPTSAYMTASGFNNSTQGFQTVVAFANGTDSIAYLNDTQGSNTFVTTLNYAYFVGGQAEFNEQVIGFPQVIGIAGLGTNDTDYMYALASGGNQFYGYAGSSYLFGGGMDDWAVNFRNVLAVADGGTNQAFFTGGPQTNTFFGYSTFSAMTGSNFDDGAIGFTTVYAVGSGTGNIAELYDSPGNDALLASGSALTLNYPAASIGLDDFDQVTATSSQGGYDTENIQAIDFALTTIGPWVNV